MQENLKLGEWNYTLISFQSGSKFKDIKEPLYFNYKNLSKKPCVDKNLEQRETLEQTPIV